MKILVVRQASFPLLNPRNFCRGFFVLSIFFDNTFPSKHVVLCEVIGWVPFAVMFVLLMGAYFLRNNYLRSLAKGYNWSDR